MSKKLRITNVTHILNKPNPGIGLDFNGSYIGAGRQLVVDLPVIPVLLEEWKKKLWIRIEDADAPVSAPGESSVTPGTVVDEAKGEKLMPDSVMKLPEPARKAELSKDIPLELEEDDFDMAVAKEASLPAQTGGMLGDMNQQSNASVTLGMEHESVSPDSVSPIPGDKPRSVDDSAQFTVRAPRAHGVGAVVQSK